jgi:predicted Zn-dependent protease
MGGWAGYAVREGARIAIPMALAKFSRGAEAEADMLGLQYMYSAGYDPAAYVEFFETLETLNKHEKTSPFASFLANHPRVRDRLRSTQKQIQKTLAPREEYVYQTSEFANVRARLQLIEKGRSVPWVSATPPVDPDVRPVLKRRD